MRQEHSSIYLIGMVSASLILSLIIIHGSDMEKGNLYVSGVSGSQFTVSLKNHLVGHYHRLASY